MPLNRVSISRVVLCLSVLLIALSAPALAQDKGAQDRNVIQEVPINPLLRNHTNWFDPVRIYDLRKDHHPLPDDRFPKEIKYDVYSAVGYDLANTMVIKGPARSDGKREIIIVDTLGNPGITKEVITTFRNTKDSRGEYIFPHDPKEKLPIKAIIYTHNHIDHTFGVWGYLTEAALPPCKPADPAKAGDDGYFDIDAQNKDCVAIIGQYNINEGVGTTAFISGTIIDARSSYMYGNFLRNYKDGGNQVNDGIGPQEYGCCFDPETGKCLTAKDKTSGKKCISLQGSYRMPSRTFTDELYVTAAGVQMKIIYVPSETNDELSVFLPDKLNSGGNVVASAVKPDDWWGRGLLFSAEVIQGPSFPNLYSLRGTSYRNPANWFRSVDKLRAYDSWCMVPSHGPPLCEAENIHRLLRNFRDAVQFTHDQTIRWMNKGFTMNELAPLVESIYLQKNGEEETIMTELDKVKPILNVNGKVVDPRDYLRPFYGSVVQGVREIYAGTVGWYEADPVALRPTTPHELGIRYVKMMGGAKQVNKAAQEALTKGEKLLAEAKAENNPAKLTLGRGEVEWAAELTSNVVRAYVTTEDLLGLTSEKSSPSTVAKEDFFAAREIKANALLKLGELAENPNWRNWYITAAHELKGFPFLEDIVGGLVAPGVQGGLPAGAWVNSLTLRLRAEITAPAHVQTSLGFWFPADQQFGALGYVLQIRNGIAEFIENTPHGDPLTREDVEKANLAISIEKKALDALLIIESKIIASRKLTEPEKKAELEKWLKEAVDAGLIKPLHNTNLAEFAAAFFGYFEPKPVGLPPLTVR